MVYVGSRAARKEGIARLMERNVTVRRSSQCASGKVFIRRGSLRRVDVWLFRHS